MFLFTEQLSKAQQVAKQSQNEAEQLRSKFTQTILFVIQHRTWAKCTIFNLIS